MRSRSSRAKPSAVVGSVRTGGVVTAALFAPLVLLLFVAGMTWRSERRVAAVTDRVVHDYAAIAVWQYARQASMSLHEEVMRAFSGSAGPGDMRSNPRVAAEPPSALLERRGSPASVFLEHARFAFTWDATTGRLESAGDTIGAPTLLMLRRRLPLVARAMRPGGEPHHALFDSADGRSHAIALWIVSGGEDTGLVVKGIATDARQLEAVFARVLREATLLPAVTGAGEVPTSDLALRLARPDGTIVFGTDRWPGSTAAVDSTGLQGGELHATLDIPPALAQELLIGGASDSQLPALALMIVAASALAIIGLVQHSRSRALSEARTRFVANVSHELRTPLAQISMFAETLYLARERSEAERRQFAGVVFAEARRLTALVENVLRFSRPEDAQTALRRRPHRVSELIGGAVGAFAPIAVATDVDIATRVPSDIFAFVDAAAFQQIMLNLLDNAVKHGGGSRVDVTACVGDDEVVVTVDDGGPGIPAEWRTRVFEPFAQVAGRNVAGAGIGLAIVRDLILAHGGRAWVETSPAGGARVAIAVPRAASDASVRTPEPTHTTA